MRGHTKALSQGAALIVGAALGVLALAGWTVRGGAIAPPAELTVTAVRSTVLDVRPSGTSAPVARKSLRAGTPALAGSVALFNATGGTLAVRVLAQTEESQLDDRVHLLVRSGGTTLFAGPLADLEHQGSRPFVLGSHARSRLAVRAWIPASAEGYEAWVVHVALRFVTRPVDGGSR